MLTAHTTVRLIDPQPQVEEKPGRFYLLANAIYTCDDELKPIGKRLWAGLVILMFLGCAWVVMAALGWGLWYWWKHIF